MAGSGRENVLARKTISHPGSDDCPRMGLGGEYELCLVKGGDKEHQLRLDGVKDALKISQGIRLRQPGTNLFQKPVSSARPAPISVRIKRLNARACGAETRYTVLNPRQC